MVANNDARAATNQEPARGRGRTGTLAYLRRIGTYLWIGLVNPGPPTNAPWHNGSRSA